MTATKTAARINHVFDLPGFGKNLGRSGGNMTEIGYAFAYYRFVLARAHDYKRANEDALKALKDKDFAGGSTSVKVTTTGKGTVVEMFLQGMRPSDASKFRRTAEQFFEIGRELKAKYEDGHPLSKVARGTT